jgi:hypothetical protein
LRHGVREVAAVLVRGEGPPSAVEPFVLRAIIFGQWDSGVSHHARLAHESVANGWREAVHDPRLALGPRRSVQDGVELAIEVIEYRHLHSLGLFNVKVSGP